MCTSDLNLWSANCLNMRSDNYPPKNVKKNKNEKKGREGIQSP